MSSNGGDEEFQQFMRQFAKDTAKNFANILARQEVFLARMEGHLASEEGNEDEETAAWTGAKGELLPSQHRPSEGSDVALAQPAPQLHAAAAAGELMEELSAEFSPVFDDPRGLPSPHDHDHRIHLMSGTSAVVVQPYTYPLQKDKLECQCTTMLAQGIIQRNSSAFPVPMLLVKKKDGSWPYRVISMINEVTYHLDLPNLARLQDVFHVNLLKKYDDLPPQDPPPLPPLLHGQVIPTPARVICARLSRDKRQILVQWEGLHVADTSWEDVNAFWASYPSFQLEDELFVNGGRDVMCGSLGILKLGSCN